MPKGMLLLSALAMTLAAGCASGTRSVVADPTVTSDGAGPASPPSVEWPRCRNSGVYNRAANLCVSEGS